ncbi:MAG: sulfotransferase [Bacteroidales bacterium]
MNYNKGENLIFLISQPRAGSTMTQRILGSHPDIHTQSEPWVMLHPLHAFKPMDMFSAFDSALYSTALEDFVQSMPGGKSTYIKAIAKTYNEFYNSILAIQAKKFFLDKTPRYYHIISELNDYFPKAKFIFLWRNPAAVISSIIHSWTKSDWYRLASFKNDLLEAPQRMIDGINLLGNKAFTIYYEELVTNPEEVLSKVCNYLNLEFEKETINYKRHIDSIWNFGDQNTVNLKSSPDSIHINHWQKNLNNPQVWRIVNDYIQFLGKNTINVAGYLYDEILNILEINKPNIDIEKNSIALHSLLDSSRGTLIEVRKLEYQLENIVKKLKLKDSYIIGIENSLSTFTELKTNNDKKIESLENELSENRNLLTKINDDVEILEKLLQEKGELLNILNKTITSKKPKEIEHNQRTIEEQQIKFIELQQNLEYFERKLKEKNELINQLSEENTQNSSKIEQGQIKIEEQQNKIIEFQQNLINIDKQLKEKDELIKQLSEENTQNSSKIEQGQIKIEEQQNRIIELQQNLANTDKQLKEKDKLINQLSEENTQNSNILEQGQIKIEEQQNKISELQHNVENADNHLKEKDKLINELSEAATHNSIKIEQIQKILEEQQIIIKELQSNLETTNKQLKEKNELIKNIETSYTFRTGKLFLWPIKKILGK